MKSKLFAIVLPPLAFGVVSACGSSRGYEEEVAPAPAGPDATPDTYVAIDAAVAKDAAAPDAPKADPKPTAIIVNLTEEPTEMAVDATNIYWITNAGSVMTCKIASCPVPTPLVTGQGALSAIAVDASYVYWTVFGTAANGYADGAIMRASKTGTNITKLAENQTKPSGLASDGTNVYWAEQSVAGNVSTCAVGGCALTPPVISPARPSPAALRADSTRLFWADQNSGEIVTTLKTADAGAPLPLAQGQGTVVGMALDADRVYWGQFASAGKILTVRKDGTGTLELAAGQGWPESLAVDATRIYWTTSTPTLPGSVVSADKATGANPKVLATVAPFRVARSLVVDAASLYWVENGGRQIMKLAK
jgi:hypothetical protein